MPKKKRPGLTDEERTKRLKEMALEVEADASGEVFRHAFRRLAKSYAKGWPFSSSRVMTVSIALADQQPAEVMIP